MNGASEKCKSDSKLRTCVVTVTYGERFHLLEQMLAAVKLSGVVKVIVVDNASGPMSRQKLEDFSIASDGWLDVVTLKTNKGSAGGFRAGLARVSEITECEFIWLLDDDNCPMPDAFAAMDSAWNFLGRNPENSLLCLRPDRSEYVRACIQGMPVKFVRDSFLGFHVKDIMRKIGKWLSFGSTPNYIVPIPLVPIEYAPYGGFFVHRSWLDRIGLPDERLYLYGDDHEFTSRITELGGRIFLCHGAQVRDLEVSWNRQHSQPFASPVKDERWVYYTMRNRVWYEKTRVSSMFVYMLNACIYLSYILLLSLLRNNRPKGVLRRIKVISKAFGDGRAGNLGEVNLIDLC